MREKERIDRILEKLEKYWKANPDLRLGQIIANFVRMSTGQLKCDPIYIEDNIIEEVLDKVNKGE